MVYSREETPDDELTKLGCLIQKTSGKRVATRFPVQTPRSTYLPPSRAAAKVVGAWSPEIVTIDFDCLPPPPISVISAACRV